MITTFDNFINEEFDFFKKKNIAIMKAIKDNGLRLYNNKDEIYRTYPDRGYEFTIASGSDAFSVDVSYYGAYFIQDELVTDLDEFISDILNGETPNVIHKFSTKN